MMKTKTVNNAVALALLGAMTWLMPEIAACIVLTAAGTAVVFKLVHR